MQLFAQSLQGFNVSIVIYVRRALPMLLSRYYQLQEGGSDVGASTVGLGALEWICRCVREWKVFAARLPQPMR